MDKWLIDLWKHYLPGTLFAGSSNMLVLPSGLAPLPVADLGFPRGGGTNSPGGAPTYDFAKFPQKLHEIERIWTPGGGARPKFYYVDPPLPSPRGNPGYATDFTCWFCIWFILHRIRNDLRHVPYVGIFFGHDFLYLNVEACMSRGKEPCCVQV